MKKLISIICLVVVLLTSSFTVFADPHGSPGTDPESNSIGITINEN